MREINQLFVGAVEMITPIGNDAQMTSASLNAGICRYSEIDLLGDDDNPARMALVPNQAILEALDKENKSGLSPLEVRLTSLAVLALQNIAPKLPGEPIPLFMAGPEPYMGTAAVSQTFIENIATGAGVDIDIASSRILNTGRAGALDVIETAFRYFSVSDTHYALVGGVDSFYDAEVLEYLNSQYRILRLDTLDGFIPGEGAGFMLLISPEAPEEIVQQASAWLARPGFTHESGHLMGGDEEYTGEALSRAVKQAGQQTGIPVNTVFSCENGEMYYAKELSIALTRNKKMMDAKFDVIRPAEFMGDLGSAFGPIALGLAYTDANNNGVSMVCCSSDSGQRSAICLGRI